MKQRRSAKRVSKADRSWGRFRLVVAVVALAGCASAPQESRMSGALSGPDTLQANSTWRVTGNEASDSASFPATLTVTGRGGPWTVRGHWGSAC